MKEIHLSAILMILAALTLTACSPYRPASGKAAICNQLNSEMIFNGSVADPRRADLQRADTPMAARTFEKDNCI